MATLKTLTIAAALIAGATSLAVAQNGPATGGEPPVAGGANGDPAFNGTSGMHKPMMHKSVKHKTLMHRPTTNYEKPQ